MNDRLKEIIEYRTGGRRKEFCEMLGWTPPYLAKLLRGENFGLRPVLTLLEVLPEINARWLLLGEGAMLNERKYSDVRREMLGAVSAVLELEKYLPFMSPEDLRRFEQAVTTGVKPVFSPDTLASWQRRASERERELEARFAAANAKSDKLCKHPTAKK